MRDDLDNVVVEEIHGQNSSNAKILLEKGRIIVVIADILLRMLTDNIASMRDFWLYIIQEFLIEFSIVVFDEIHHSLKEHSFNKIASIYRQEDALFKPKLLGLSASPAGTLVKPLGNNVKRPKTSCQL